ncbi:unnamed protein product [Bathycoccus prasinos]
MKTPKRFGQRGDQKLVSLGLQAIGEVELDNDQKRKDFRAV